MAGQLSQHIIKITQEGQDYLVKGNNDGRSTQPTHQQPHTGGQDYQTKGKPATALFKLTVEGKEFGILCCTVQAPHYWTN